MSSGIRPGLTRESIQSAALALLDEVGLDALSMRRLADRLRVQSPALYWHFANKRELLEGMAEQIYLDGGMGAPAPDETWQEWVMRRSRAYRAALTSYRDGARVAAEANPSSPTLFRLFDEEISAMVRFGFTPKLALDTISVVTHFIAGFVLKEQAPSNQGSPVEEPLEMSETLKAAFEGGGGPLSADVFDHGIRMIITGAAAEMDSPKP